MTTIRHEMSLAATPDQVLAAVTTREGVVGWWAKDADVGVGVGATHELRFAKDGRTVVMRFEVTEISPERVVWRCADNGNPVWPGTTLTFSAQAASAGATEFRFAHAGFAEDSSPPYAMTVDGWSHFMASLRQFVETGTGMPW